MEGLLFNLDKITIIGGILWIVLWFVSISVEGKKSYVLRIANYFIFLFVWFHLIGKDSVLSVTDIYWTLLGAIGVLLFIFIDHINPFGEESIKVDDEIFSFEDKDVENEAFRVKAFEILEGLTSSQKEKVAKFVKKAIRGDFWIWNLLLRISLIVIAFLGVKYFGWMPWVYLPMIIILWRLDWYISDSLPNLTWIDLYRVNPSIFERIGVNTSFNNLAKAIFWPISEWFCIFSTIGYTYLLVDGVPFEFIEWIGIIFLLANVPYYIFVGLGRRATLPLKVPSTNSFLIIVPALILVLLLGEKGFYIVCAWAVLYLLFFVFSEFKKSYAHLKGKKIIAVLGIFSIVFSLVESYPRLMALRTLRQAEQSTIIGNIQEAESLIKTSSSFIDTYDKTLRKLHLSSLFGIVPFTQKQTSILLEAKLLESRGDYSRSSEYLRNLAKLSRFTSKSTQTKRILLETELYHLMRNYEKENEMIKRAYKIAKTMINRPYWEAYVNCYQARLDIASKNYEKAKALLKPALKTGKKVGSYKLNIQALHGLGDAYYGEGKYEEAKGYYEEALKLARKLKAKADEGLFLLKLAKAEKVLGRIDLALKDLFQVSTLAKKTASYELLWRADYEMGLILEAKGRGKEAFERYAQAIEVIEKIRGGLHKEEYRLGYMAGKMPVYEQAVLLAYRMGKKDRAFSLVQKAKARVLLDLLGSRMVAQREEDRRLARREHLLQVKIKALMERISEEEAKPKRLQSRKLKKWREELRSALKEHETLLAEIKRTNPRLASLVTAPTVGLREVQSALYPDESLVEYFVTGDKTLVWVVRKNKVKPLELPVGRGEVSDLVSNIRSEISTPSFSPSISLLHQAYRKLLASVAPYLAHNIILAPHDQLYLLPFEALVVNKAGPYYVVDSHFVSYYSSGSALVLNRRYQEKKPSPSKPLFAVADPVFGPKDSRYRGGLQLAKAERGALARRVWMSNEMGSLVQEKKQEKLVFNRLPNTALEVKGIASLYGISEKSTDINIGFSATEKVVKQADHTKYRFEHYATHGVVRGDVPGIKEPALVFALPNPEDPELDEGFWTMSEIFGMKSNAEMVVLSACKTALGEEVPGEGLIGLTRAFMYAGAPTVVASLWSVNDPATAFLMKSFYRYLRKGIDKSRALTLAKRETMRRFHNPYYWAPFIMEGEGR